MEISKIKAVWSFITGGWSGLCQYVLTVVNAALAKCDEEKCRNAATIAIGVAAVVKTACEVFAPDKYKSAAANTITALEKLAVALEDGKLTKEEISGNIDAISACVEAWKEVR